VELKMEIFWRDCGDVNLTSGGGGGGGEGDKEEDERRDEDETSKQREKGHEYQSSCF
jgi:hypothetical protein